MEGKQIIEIRIVQHCIIIVNNLIQLDAYFLIHLYLFPAGIRTLARYRLKDLVQ